MAFFNEETRKQLLEIFKNLEKKVSLLFFTEKYKCHFCKETYQLYEELTGLTDKISVTSLELKDSIQIAQEYNIMHITPATLILDETGKDTRIRFYGIPSGHEFTSLLETIKLVSTGSLLLKPETIDFIRSADKKIDLKVFVSNSCPYCPAAVFLAHQFAFASENITSSMIETAEFPHLANKYSIMGVPKTVINETETIEGAAGEEMLIEKIKNGLNGK
ncbi:thioredoxin family protein [Elusimicrobiota bacterium]